MSHDNLPQPLPGAPALRAHLKALERGVHEARTQRLGAPISASRAPAAHMSNGTMGSMIGGTETPNGTSPYIMPKPGTSMPAASSSSSGKPRAARAKSAADFGAFFNSIDKRAAS